jgi:hypothetical protein
MLGDKIGDVTGVGIIQRVLPAVGGAPRTETTQRGTGTLLGIVFQEMVTYESSLRPNGTIFGEGQGIITGEGGEAATWVGRGVGTRLEGGAVRFRGAIYYQTTSTPWLRLNGVAIVYEHGIDAEGKYRTEFWEWK